MPALAVPADSCPLSRCQSCVELSLGRRARTGYGIHLPPHSERFGPACVVQRLVLSTATFAPVLFFIVYAMSSQVEDRLRRLEARCRLAFTTDDEVARELATTFHDWTQNRNCSPHCLLLATFLQRVLPAFIKHADESDAAKLTMAQWNIEALQALANHVDNIDSHGLDSIAKMVDTFQAKPVGQSTDPSKGGPFLVVIVPSTLRIYDMHPDVDGRSPEGLLTFLAHRTFKNRRYGPAPGKPRRGGRGRGGGGGGGGQASVPASAAPQSQSKKKQKPRTKSSSQGPARGRAKTSQSPHYTTPPGSDPGDIAEQPARQGPDRPVSVAFAQTQSPHPPPAVSPPARHRSGSQVRKRPADRDTNELAADQDRDRSMSNVGARSSSKRARSETRDPSLARAPRD